MDEREKRIRDRAYRIWEEEGRPHGREAEHWALAREAVAIEENEDLTLKPNPAADHPASAELAEPVEEASIQQNLGEFPTVFTDQGDRQQTPQPPKRAQAEAPAAPRPARAKAATAPKSSSDMAEAGAPKRGAAKPKAETTPKPKAEAAAKPKAPAVPKPKAAKPAGKTEGRSAPKPG